MCFKRLLASVVVLYCSIANEGYAASSAFDENISIITLGTPTKALMHAPFAERIFLPHYPLTILKKEERILREIMKQLFVLFL